MMHTMRDTPGGFQLVFNESGLTSSAVTQPLERGAPSEQDEVEETWVQLGKEVLKNRRQDGSSSEGGSTSKSRRERRDRW